MTLVKLGEVVTEYKRAFNGNRKDMPVVGLEHIVPGELIISNYQMNSESTLNRTFKKGQVLFGRRRAYQKKTAYATFDGICSGDIIVAEPLGDKMIEAFLPFVMSSDRFYQYAVEQSKGSLSPRVNWADLSNYEFYLPDIEGQRSLSNKLWAAYRLKESYKKMIDVTKEMVKSQFIEMFGNLPMKRLIDVARGSGVYGSNTPADDYNGYIRYVRITDINDDGTLNATLVSPKIIENKYKLETNDLLFARTGNTVGKTYLHKSGEMIFAGYLIRYQLNEDKMLPKFAFSYTHTDIYYSWVSRTKKVGAQPNISAAQYDLMPIPIPSIEEQMKFVSIAEQADKSEFELHKAINSIDTIIKSLINNHS